MTDARQRAYLEAMGVAVWTRRKAGPLVVEDKVLASGIKLGPGSGGTLLVCAADSDSATRLANDINRALGIVPVWAWPDSGTGAVSLTDAIGEHLFTTVAIFGSELARQFISADIPSTMQAARLVLLPDMQSIQNQATARRLLWAELCRNNMVVSH